MRLLELFSGTHSIGKVATRKGYEVYSLDRDLGGSHDGYASNHHIQTDVINWDYTQYPRDFFQVITASPVCLYWSKLRYTWVGRISPAINPDRSIVKKEDIHRDIELLGKPMVDQVIKIIEYFKPKYWWIENPKSGAMKDYIASKYPQYNKFYDADYCKYSDWGYKKSTRFWTNIDNFKAKTCNRNCDNMLYVDGKKTKRHKKTVDGGGNRDNNNGRGSVKMERYRIPANLIDDLLNAM